MNNAQRAVALLLLAPSFFTACKSQPNNRSVDLSQSASITLVAYGDTRTGPWGLGDNAKQAMHSKVIDDILANDGQIDAVLFTGDAVMSNFKLWRDSYWKAFLTQANRFGASGIPFYPELGNHEVLSEALPMLKYKAVSYLISEGESAAQNVRNSYDMGEEPSANQLSRLNEMASKQTLDPNTPQGLADLQQWEAGVNNGDASAAYKFGQFENHVQSNFYATSTQDRCASDAKTFSDDYLVRAKYEYLRGLLQGRSYYSQVITKNGTGVLVIALDTNCLDSIQQQTFLASEVQNFSGPIIVFGHIPPIDYTVSGGWPWDKVPGWDALKSYFANPKIVLWVFGHVHDYQRRGPTSLTDIPNRLANVTLSGIDVAEAPVMLIAGGGGASLESVSKFQWQPASWPAPYAKTIYNQVKITVTSSSIAVQTRGTADMATPFQMIDSFTIPLGGK